MRAVSIINLKGGVGKTTTAVSMAELLAERYDKKVLLWDNDKQGNTSRLFGMYDKNSEHGTHNVLVTGSLEGNIKKGEKFDIVPSNYSVEEAEAWLMKQTIEQHNRYRKALEPLQEDYDYCIIDNAPDVGLPAINAIIASDEVIIPVNLDNYSIDGLAELVGNIERLKVLNPEMKLAGVLITDYERGEMAEAAEEWLREKSGCPVFTRCIRHSKKAKEATFYHKTVNAYSCRSGAAQDYKAFVDEYIRRQENGV